MSDVSVVNDIIDTADATLVQTMQVLIDASDSTRAGLVRAGLLQDDPEQFGISVLTHTGDPNNEEGWDNSVVPGPETNLRLDIPGYEVGGGEMWFYRFTTEITMFWKTGLSRSEARHFTAIVLSRAKHTLKNLIFETSPDSFGEYPHKAYVVSTRMIESGGGDEFIWRANLHWQVLVSS